MTYTFDPDLSDDVSLVRFHIGDNNSEGHYLEDETIQYFVTSSDVGHAVVAGLKYIIQQLSMPGFSVGWMNVSNADARAGYEKMLLMKAQEFGLSATGAMMGVSIRAPSRADSYQTSNNYNGGLP